MPLAFAEASASSVRSPAAPMQQEGWTSPHHSTLSRSPAAVSRDVQLIDQPTMGYRWGMGVPHAGIVIPGTLLRASNADFLIFTRMLRPVNGRFARKIARYVII
jgi:hypothetical protein